MSDRRVLVVVNPRAGRLRPLTIAERTVAHLREAGCAVELAETKHAGHATEIARERGAAFDLLVVVGGDGTLRETLVGLGESDAACPLALVPVGNANVVARDLAIPLEPESAIALCLDGAPRAIDVGRVDDGTTSRLFLGMVGVGFDAIVTRSVDRFRRTAPGRWFYEHGFADTLYTLFALPTLVRLRPRRFRLEAEGSEVVTGAPTLLVSNTLTYAKGWCMTPAARIDSGRLHWVASRHGAGIPVLLHLHAAARGRAVSPSIASYGEGTGFRLVSDQPFRWQADGDPMSLTSELAIEILPAYARLIAPR